MAILWRLPIIWELEFELEILNPEIKIFVQGTVLRFIVKGTSYEVWDVSDRNLYYDFGSQECKIEVHFSLKYPNHVIRKL